MYFETEDIADELSCVKITTIGMYKDSSLLGQDTLQTGGGTKFFRSLLNPSSGWSKKSNVALLFVSWVQA